MESASQACVPTDGCVDGYDSGGGGGGEYGGGGGGGNDGRVSGEVTSKPVMVPAKALPVGGRNGAGSANPASRLALTTAGVIPTTSKLAIVEPE